jgi:hypothetical protein
VRVPDGRAERLGAVDDEQRRAVRVEAALVRRDEEIADEGGVLRRPLDEREGVLGPVEADLQRDDEQKVGEVDPSIIKQTRSSPARSADSSSASADSVAWTKRRETAEREVARATFSTAWPTGLRPCASRRVESLASMRSIAICARTSERRRARRRGG